MKTAHLTVRLDPEVKKQLEEIAEANCRRMGEQITAFVKEYLKKPFNGLK